MQDSYRVVTSLIRTEKGTRMLPFNKYLFLVDKEANKISIKHAVEQIYKVKVKEVNTLVMRGKKKRVRFAEGKTPDWKKAIVTLQAGEKIEIT